MEQPLVSVVMPTYHSEKHLTRAIASILAQTYKNLELIIVSDEINEWEHNYVVGYCCADSRVFHIENKTRLGLIKSLNLGISVARGKYIARMDADDYSHSQRIEKQVAYMEEHPDVGVLGTSVILVDRGKKRYLKAPEDTAGIIAMMMFYGCPIFHPSVIMRADFIKGIPGPYQDNFRFAEDYDLWIRCIGKTKMANLPDPLIEYQRTPESIGITHNKEQKEDIRKLMALSAKTAGFPERQLYQSEESYFIECNNFNDKHKILNAASFKKYVGEGWYNYCLLQAYQGWTAWNTFWNSPLCECICLSALRKIKFAGVCILHKRL
jgi:glycosyltransferase involved in cell wall biosynthesis